MVVSMAQGYMLQEAASRLPVGNGSSIPRAGGEDDAQLLQDGLVIALGMHSPLAPGTVNCFKWGVDTMRPPAGVSPDPGGPGALAVVGRRASNRSNAAKS